MQILVRTHHPEAAQLRETVERLRGLSPLWDMHQAGIDLNSVQWAEH